MDESAVADLSASFSGLGTAPAIPFGAAVTAITPWGLDRFREVLGHPPSLSFFLEDEKPEKAALFLRRLENEGADGKMLAQEAELKRKTAAAELAAWRETNPDSPESPEVAQQAPFEAVHIIQPPHAVHAFAEALKHPPSMQRFFAEDPARAYRFLDILANTRQAGRDLAASALSIDGAAEFLTISLGLVQMMRLINKLDELAQNPLMQRLADQSNAQLNKIFSPPPPPPARRQAAEGPDAP